MRGRDWVGAVTVTAIVFSSVAYGAGPNDRIQMALHRRFQPSVIEVQDPAHRGMIVRQGQVLTLVTDGVPAKPFRVARSSSTSMVTHVMDFARVDVTMDGRTRTETDGFRLPKDTRLVVLDVRVEGDRAHLLTHTAEPLPGSAAGAATYGCTDFVFQIPQMVLRGGDVEPLIQFIERTLEWSSETRACAPHNRELCLEP